MQVGDEDYIVCRDNLYIYVIKYDGNKLNTVASI